MKLIKDWTTTEKNQLLNEINDNVDYDTIALNHNTTTLIIKTRIFHMSYKMYLQDIPIDDIIIKMKLNKDTFFNYIYKQNKKKNISNNENLYNKSIFHLFNYFINPIYKNTLIDNLYTFDDNNIIIQNEPIMLNDNFHYILNIENMYFKKITIGNFIIFEVNDLSWIDKLNLFKNNIYLYTGCIEWIKLINKNIYIIEIENSIKNVLIGEICYFNELIINTSLYKFLNHKCISFFNNINKSIDIIHNINARCYNSMFLLDDIHRNYINTINFNKNNIYAIKSVAGSGKTTTLLNLAKIHSSKKILYLAFNKNLISDIKNKVSNDNIENLYPYTFDSILYKLYKFKNGHNPDIFDLKPNTISNLIPIFNNKYFNIKKFYIKHLSKFCNQSEFNDIKSYSINILKDNKPLLNILWDFVEKNKLVTFETIRKQAFMFHWFKDYIDNNFDMIMIDETQDFDLIMLNILINDTSIPKIFVGDPKQSIYQFRGCINAFNFLPTNSFIIEFYSTFRVGNPSCQIISNKYKNLWMISKSNNITNFVDNFNHDEKYIYLFRSWKILLQNASNYKNIWIFNHEKKLNDIRKLHEKLSNVKHLQDDDNFEDDLPKFLKSISLFDLDQLLTKIENNIVDKHLAIIEFYTVHSFKGMEHDNVRLASDINIHEDENIFYVAITRGMKKIMIDSNTNHLLNISDNSSYNPKLINNNINNKKSEKIPSNIISFQLYNQNNSIQEISKIRNISTKTIFEHILINLKQHDIIINDFMTNQEFIEIKNALKNNHLIPLKNIKDTLSNSISYDKIKIARKFIYNV